MRKILILSFAAISVIVAVGYANSAIVCRDGVSSCNFAEATTIATKEKLRIYYDVPLERRLQDYIVELCKANNISSELIFAIIQVESSYCETAVNTSENCFGLMQINECNFNTYQLDEPMNPYENVRVGITIFSELLRRYEDVNKALIAYNCGVAGAERLWSNGITQTSYCRKVASAKQEIIEKGRVYIVETN